MKANMIRQAVDFLAYKGLGEVDFEFSSTWKNDIRLEVAFSGLTKEELTNLKRVFGPLKAEVDQYSSRLKGEHKITEDFRVELTISSAFECEELTAESLTDEKMDKLRVNIASGTVKVMDCTPKTLDAEDHTYNVEVF